MIANRIKNINKSLIREIFDLAPKNSINMGLGELQFKQSSIINKYITKIIDKEKIVYSTNSGLLKSRKILADNYSGYSPNDFILTTGATEAVFSTLFSIINPKQEVIICSPDYLAYPTIIKMLDGIPVIWQGEKDFSFNISKLEKLITSHTKALIFSNPSNPLGTFFTEKDQTRIVEICKKNNIILIVDEIYIKLKYNNNYTSFSNFNYKNIVIINGLSKSHNLSGWRIGWLASKNNELISKINLSHQFITTCSNYLSQRLIEFSFSKEGKDLNEYYKLLLKKNKEIIQRFFDNLDLEFISPKAGPYIFVNFNKNDIDLCKYFAKQGIILTPGSAFGKKHKKWIRINFSLEPELLKSALKKFKLIYEKI